MGPEAIVACRHAGDEGYAARIGRASCHLSDDELPGVLRAAKPGRSVGRNGCTPRGVRPIASLTRP